MCDVIYERSCKNKLGIRYFTGSRTTNAFDNVKLQQGCQIWKWAMSLKVLTCRAWSDLEFVWADFPLATSKQVESFPRTISNPEKKFCCRPVKVVRVWEIWMCRTGCRWSDWNSDPECEVLDWPGCGRCLSWRMKFRYPEKMFFIKDKTYLIHEPRSIHVVGLLINM